MALKDVGVKLVVQGANAFRSQIGSAQGSVSRLGNTIMQHHRAIGAAMTAMGGAVIAAGLMSVKTYAEMGDEVQKMALRTKWSTESLSELRHVAEISGTELTAFEKGTRKMSKSIIDAADGLETYLRDFEKLGLNVNELKEMKPEDAFWEIAFALSEMENDIEQSAVALNVFGRQGTQLLPMLAQGAEGIAELRQEAHELGIVFDQEAANKAAEFTDEMNNMKSAINGLKMVIGGELIPQLQPLVEGTTDLVSAFSAWSRGNPELVRTLISIGGALAAFMVTAGPLIMALPFLASGFAMLINPITLAAAGITGLSLVGYGLSKVAGNISTELDKVTPKMKDFILNVGVLGELAEEVKTLDYYYAELYETNTRWLQELDFTAAQWQVIAQNIARVNEEYSHYIKLFEYHERQRLGIIGTTPGGEPAFFGGGRYGDENEMMLAWAALERRTYASENMRPPDITIRSTTVLDGQVVGEAISRVQGSQYLQRERMGG